MEGGHYMDLQKLKYNGNFNLIWVVSVASVQGFYSSPHNAVHPFRGFYSIPASVFMVEMTLTF